MIERQFKKRIGLLLTLVFIVTVWSIGQIVTTDLQEALRIARNNHIGLERDRLAVEQQNKLVAAGLPQLPAQLYISGEEFGTNSQTGVHSINLNQNFYLPKVSKVQRAFNKSGAALAEKQVALTENELKRHVGEAYYKLLYAKREQELAAENVALYTHFLNVTTVQLESGETGRIPQLAARTHLGQSLLEQEHASEKHQIALTLFNQWLGSDTAYDAKGDLLYDAKGDLSFDNSVQNNTGLQIIKARQDLAKANIEVEKAQLLPQINSGFKLQTANGNFPLFGYQIGVNVPLFKKAYNGRIEAAEVGVKVQEADLRSKEQELERIISELRYRMNHQQHILQYLQQDLTPIVNEQSEINLRAYREGEISFLEYLDSLKQVVKVKEQHSAALFKYVVLNVELAYWLGN